MTAEDILGLAKQAFLYEDADAFKALADAYEEAGDEAGATMVRARGSLLRMEQEWAAHVDEGARKLAPLMEEHGRDAAWLRALCGLDERDGWREEMDVEETLELALQHENDEDWIEGEIRREG